MSRYDDHPGHPLCGVPDEILDAARQVLADAVDWNDVSSEMAEPIADAVVMKLVPWLVLPADERSDDERIDKPITADDYLFAAQAWTKGTRSTWNLYCGLHGDRPSELAACATEDSQKAQALAAVAAAMFARDAR